MKDLREILSSGKTRGYETEESLNSETYILQFAIKKKFDKYLTYTFKIPKNQYNYEDYADEELKEFNTYEDAVNHLMSQGASIEKFSAFTKTAPI